MLSTPKELSDALRRFIAEQADGNASLAARKLGINRVDLYRYLEGVKPRGERRARLSKALAVASQDPSVAEIGAGVLSETDRAKLARNLLHMLQYMIQLIEVDIGLQNADLGNPGRPH